MCSQLFFFLLIFFNFGFFPPNLGKVIFKKMMVMGKVIPLNPQFADLASFTVCSSTASGLVDFSLCYNFTAQ